VYNIFLGAEVTGTAADTNTIRIGFPYDGTNGQLGTVTAGVMSGEGVSGGPAVPVSQLLRRVDDQQKLLREQQVVNAELRARLARVEALLLQVAGRK
jgi:hypothetical protein